MKIIFKDLLKYIFKFLTTRKLIKFKKKLNSLLQARNKCNECKKFCENQRLFYTNRIIKLKKRKEDLITKYEKITLDDFQNNRTPIRTFSKEYPFIDGIINQSNNYLVLIKENTFENECKNNCYLKIKNITDTIEVYEKVCFN